MILVIEWWRRKEQMLWIVADVKSDMLRAVLWCGHAELPEGQLSHSYWWCSSLQKDQDEFCVWGYSLSSHWNKCCRKRQADATHCRWIILLPTLVKQPEILRLSKGKFLGTESVTWSQPYRSFLLYRLQIGFVNLSPLWFVAQLLQVANLRLCPLQSELHIFSSLAARHQHTLTSLKTKLTISMTTSVLYTSSQHFQMTQTEKSGDWLTVRDL